MFGHKRFCLRIFHVYITAVIYHEGFSPRGDSYADKIMVKDSAGFSCPVKYILLQPDIEETVHHPFLLNIFPYTVFAYKRLVSLRREAYKH